jgi:hypothetical protein
VPTAGRLVVVGTGIRTVGQLTTEAIAWLKAADVVLHAVTDPVAVELIDTWQPESNRSLRVHYAEGRPRRDTYEAMTAEIVAEVSSGKTVCVAFYGHPAVFARSTHASIKAVRELGYQAEMLPGISAEDCLFADLGVDPGDGCLSFEATNFVLFDHAADPAAHLVLWQVGMLGDWTHRSEQPPSGNLELLAEKLSIWYPPAHLAIVYQASVFPKRAPRADEVAIADLPRVALTRASTLYVPPAARRGRDARFADRLDRIE